MEKICANCIWWRTIPAKIAMGERDRGECRIKPPQLVQWPLSGPQTAWPITNKTDWCGEYASPQMFPGGR